MSLHKIIKVIAFALAIVGAVFAAMIIAGDDMTAEKMGSNMLYVTYITLGIILAMVTIFVIKGLFAGNIKKTLLTVGIFLAIVAVSYTMSSGTDLDLNSFTNKGLEISETTSKQVGAGLYTFYILAFLAIASMAYSGVKKIFNK